MILSVEELEFLYRNRKVLHEIAFSIDEGEIVAILGPNGVGKTTLLKCLNRILRPKGGAVHLDGNNLFDLGTMEIARLVGYVPQRVETGRLTAFDAVLLGRRPHIKWDVTEKDLLDLRNQVEILAIIRQIVLEHGIAAVMTMHDLNQALRYADRFILLKGGKVHAHGGAEVITPQVIEEVYGLPVVIGEIAGMRCVVPGNPEVALVNNL